MVPDSVVESLATDLRLSQQTVRDLIASTVPGPDSPAILRRLADKYTWQYNEAKSYIHDVRRRLVELGYLEDLRVAQDIRYGPPRSFIQVEGPVVSAKVENEGQANEQISVRLSTWANSLVYPAGAPRFPEVKAALLAGGVVHIWTPPDEGALNPRVVLRIWQIEKDAQVLVWYADTALYFGNG